ncbi:MAG: CotH kinase family protein [Methylococcales bacterium]
MLFLSLPGIICAKSVAYTPVSWQRLDLKLNGIGVGIELPNKVLLVSLGDGFISPTHYDAVFNYQLDSPAAFTFSVNSGYSFAINGTPIQNGSNFRFTGIKYGSIVPLQRYFNGSLIDTYSILFTNLPVMELRTARTPTDTKSPSLIRLMSGKFNQDTGFLQNSAIQLRWGDVTQSYPKLSYTFTAGGKNAYYPTGKAIQLLDMRKTLEWTLNAVYRDKSYARNLVSYDIYRDLQGKANVGLNGQSEARGHLIEVIQNGVYQGIYSLEETIDQHLLDLKPVTVPLVNGKTVWNQVDFTKPENGSVLYRAKIGQSVFYDALSVQTNFEQIYPNSKAIDRWQPLVELTNFVANASDQEFIAGIGNRIDIDSFVDWWLLIEVSRASDNIKKNFYLAKNGGGKFFIVPWSHQASFGMDWEGTPYSASRWPTDWSDTDENKLIHRLLTLPATGFNTKLKVRWNALRSEAASNLIARFEGYLNQSKLGGAKTRDLFTWPDSNHNDNVDSIAVISDFIKARVGLVDTIINKLPEK